jgi:sulfite reductase alpha subunit-like flavoprotein
MFQSSGVAEVITAFSRDQPHKVYVFHKLTERAAEIWELVQQGAVIYVSGSAGAMPKLVKRTFVEIFQAQGALSELHADELLRQLEKSNRYKEETWS